MKSANESFEFSIVCFSTRLIFVVINRFRSYWLARHAIFFAYPPPQIDKLTALGTKGTKRIVVPFDTLVTRRTLH
jgi:hypothetical protein